MHDEWLAFEHHRIHVMELWPSGPKKEAGLAAARSALGSLTRTIPKESSFSCEACTSRRHVVTVIPLAPQVHRLSSCLAA